MATDGELSAARVEAKAKAHTNDRDGKPAVDITDLNARIRQLCNPRVKKQHVQTIKTTLISQIQELVDKAKDPLTFKQLQTYLQGKNTKYTEQIGAFFDEIQLYGLDELSNSYANNREPALPLSAVKERLGKESTALDSLVKSRDYYAMIEKFAELTEREGANLAISDLTRYIEETHKKKPRNVKALLQNIEACGFEEIRVATKERRDPRLKPKIVGEMVNHTLGDQNRDFVQAVEALNDGKKTKAAILNFYTTLTKKRERGGAGLSAADLAQYFEHEHRGTHVAKLAAGVQEFGLAEMKSAVREKRKPKKAGARRAPSTKGKPAASKAPASNAEERQRAAAERRAQMDAAKVAEREAKKVAQAKRRAEATAAAKAEQEAEKERKRQEAEKPKAKKTAETKKPKTPAEEKLAELKERLAELERKKAAEKKAKGAKSGKEGTKAKTSPGKKDSATRAKEVAERKARQDAAKEAERKEKEAAKEQRRQKAAAAAQRVEADKVAKEEREKRRQAAEKKKASPKKKTKASQRREAAPQTEAAPQMPDFVEEATTRPRRGSFTLPETVTDLAVLKKLAEREADTERTGRERSGTYTKAEASQALQDFAEREADRGSTGRERSGTYTKAEASAALKEFAARQEEAQAKKTEKHAAAAYGQQESLAEGASKKKHYKTTGKAKVAAAPEPGMETEKDKRERLASEKKASIVAKQEAKKRASAELLAKQAAEKKEKQRLTAERQARVQANRASLKADAQATSHVAEDKPARAPSKAKPGAKKTSPAKAAAAQRAAQEKQPKITPDMNREERLAALAQHRKLEAARNEQVRLGKEAEVKARLEAARKEQRLQKEQKRIHAEEVRQRREALEAKKKPGAVKTPAVQQAEPQGPMHRIHVEDGLTNMRQNIEGFDGSLERRSAGLSAFESRLEDAIRREQEGGFNPFEKATRVGDGEDDGLRGGGSATKFVPQIGDIGSEMRDAGIGTPEAEEARKREAIEDKRREAQAMMGRFDQQAGSGSEYITPGESGYSSEGSDKAAPERQETLRRTTKRKKQAPVIETAVAKAAREEAEEELSLAWSLNRKGGKDLTTAEAISRADQAAEALQASVERFSGENFSPRSKGASRETAVKDSRRLDLGYEGGESDTDISTAYTPSEIAAIASEAEREAAFGKRPKVASGLSAEALAKLEEVKQVVIENHSTGRSNRQAAVPDEFKPRDKIPRDVAGLNPAELQKREMQQKAQEERRRLTSRKKPNPGGPIYG